jgi:hypothetical protein
VKHEYRHNVTGTSIDDWFANFPEDIEDIGIGLCLIVMTGRHNFGLTGAELLDFVRRSIYALLEKGGKPRHWGSPSHPDRNIMLHYGNDTNEEIVEGVIAEWLASGGDDPEWGDFWFALPGTLDD